MADEFGVHGPAHHGIPLGRATDPRPSPATSSRGPGSPTVGDFGRRRIRLFSGSHGLARARSGSLWLALLRAAKVIEPNVVDPNAMVARLDAMLRRVLGPRVRLASMLHATRHVRVDPTQLEQVLLDLATNARDAMADGGELTITTADLEIGAGAGPQPPELAAGRYVTLCLRDSGPGIPPEALVHLFEPFSSTREGGTGLGLATCHGIVV